MPWYDLLSTPTAKAALSRAVLSFLDYFAGQENSAEEVRDFVQRAARFVEEARPMIEWENDQMLGQFYLWFRDNYKEK